MTDNRTTEQCGNCRFWKRMFVSATLGFCQRFPKPIKKEDYSWCGEWTPDVMAEIERMGESIDASGADRR